MGEQAAILKQGLLTVLGDPSDFADEIWARQLGAWLYLPGIPGEDAMEQICVQARDVTNPTMVA